MAYYVSAQALLADVRLRLDGLGPESAALVVEGPDDKKLFYHRAANKAEVVPSGGKRLLRSSLQEIENSDSGRILFFTDCDYDVLRRELRGGPDVVITHSCDVEADLIALDLLEKVVVELIPSVVHAKDSAVKVASDVRRRAETMARLLGKVRIVAQPFGVDLGFERLNHAKYWDKLTDGPMGEKLISEMFRRLKSGGIGISEGEWGSLVEGAPDDSIVCNGKDLIAISRMLMCMYYKMDHRVTADMLTAMIRLALDEARFEAWSVVQRIRQWEKRNNRPLLTAVALCRPSTGSVRR